VGAQQRGPTTGVKRRGPRHVERGHLSLRADVTPHHSAAAALDRGVNVDEHSKFIASMTDVPFLLSAEIRWGRGRNGRCLIELKVRREHRRKEKKQCGSRVRLYCVVEGQRGSASRPTTTDRKPSTG